MVAGELERGRWGLYNVSQAPRGKRVDVSILTPVRTRALRTPCLDHLPQVLPTSLWPAPPSTPTRRRGRGTSRDTSLLCPSLIPRRRWARTPALFGLRPGPSWNEGFEGCWARLRLPKLLNHRLNGGYRKARKARPEHRAESPSLSSRYLPGSPTDVSPLPPWPP